MVFFFLTELAVETTWWTIKKTYHFGYYLVFGHQETIEEKMLKMIEKLEEENRQMTLKLDALTTEKSEVN